MLLPLRLRCHAALRLPDTFTLRFFAAAAPFAAMPFADAVITCCCYASRLAATRCLLRFFALQYVAIVYHTVAIRVTALPFIRLFRVG